MISDPRALALAGGDLWVANAGTVSEIDASTGALIRVISGASYKFTDSVAIAARGSRVWTVSSFDNSVTEIRASTGALVRVISGPAYQFARPDGVAFDGKHLWIPNDVSQSVTEFPAM